MVWRQAGVGGGVWCGMEVGGRGGGTWEVPPAPRHHGGGSLNMPS